MAARERCPIRKINCVHAENALIIFEKKINGLFGWKFYFCDTDLFLQLSKFTKMNVWTYVYYWVGKYPVGPQDIMCSERTYRYKDADNQTAIFTP